MIDRYLLYCICMFVIKPRPFALRISLYLETKRDYTQAVNDATSYVYMDITILP